MAASGRVPVEEAVQLTMRLVRPDKLQSMVGLLGGSGRIEEAKLTISDPGESP
jgi:hypothetical protein